MLGSANPMTQVKMFVRSVQLSIVLDRNAQDQPVVSTGLGRKLLPVDAEILSIHCNSVLSAGQMEFSVIYQTAYDHPQEPILQRHEIMVVPVPGSYDIDLCDEIKTKPWAFRAYAKVNIGTDARPSWEMLAFFTRPELDLQE